MPYIEEERKREETEITRWKTVLEKAGIPADYRLMMGRLHESFVKAITEYSPDLLVIGYRSHMLRPSSSDRLVRSLEMPMLVVRGKRSESAATGPAAVKKILCAIDFSDSSRKALQRASAYASAFSAVLDVVHAVPSHAIKDRWSQGEQSGKSDMDEFDRTMKAEAREALIGMIRDSGVQAEGKVVHGNPAEMICAAAETGEYDLIIMGARGLSYIKGLLIGSTTEAVLKTSPCPVLIVH
jgi:nucleotide-binding universal stress UspA family protein